jgi:hypothetical protein
MPESQSPENFGALIGWGRVCQRKKQRLRVQAVTRARWVEPLPGAQAGALARRKRLGAVSPLNEYQGTLHMVAMPERPARQRWSMRFERGSMR